jgi:hypothetical protein
MSPLMRGVLALSALAAWVGLSGHLGGKGLPYPRGLAALIDLSWVLSPVGHGVLTALFVGAVVLNAARIRPYETGVLAFAVMALAANVDGSQYPEPGEHHGKLLPINALLAATIGLWWGGERAARDAAAGVVAGSYTMAALVKLWRSGPLWAETMDLPLLSAERAVGAPWPLDTIRMAVAHHPQLALAGGVGVHVLELLGVLFLWPRFRRPFAVAMIAAHVSIGVLLGYSYPDWILVLVALGLLPSPVAAGFQPAADAGPTRPR